MLEKRKRKLFLNEYISLTGFNRKYAITKINACIKRKTHVFNNKTCKTNIFIKEKFSFPFF